MSYGNINYKWEKRGYPLSNDEIRTIREQHSQGSKTIIQLAKEYHVSYRLVETVVKRLYKYAIV